MGVVGGPCIPTLIASQYSAGLIAPYNPHQSHFSTMLNIIAFDPGVTSGAIAYSFNGGIYALKMPEAGKELDINSVSQLLHKIQPKVAVIEKVHAMPGQGVTSMFNFGKGYGSLLGVCIALDVPTELVTPQRWKGRILAGTKKDKHAAIDYCRRVFPQVSLIPERCKKPHNGIADALCILEYGRREYLN